MVNLKELLKKDFGIDYPISGGTGNSKDNPIVVHYEFPNGYTSVEYAVIRCIATGRRIQWKFLQQSLMHHDGRELDQLKIETKWREDNQLITQVENYYFDITECFANHPELSEVEKC